LLCDFWMRFHCQISLLCFFIIDVYPLLIIALRFLKAFSLSDLIALRFYILMCIHCWILLCVFIVNVFDCMDILLWRFFHFKTTFVAYVPGNFPFGLHFVTDLPMVCIVTLFRNVFSFNDGLRWMCCHLFITCILMVINSYLCFSWTPMTNPNHYRYTCVLTSFDSEILITTTTFLLARI
jgi:hypothetical protein